MWWSIPTLLLLVFAITLALGKRFLQVFIAVGLTMWVNVARLVGTGTGCKGTWIHWSHKGPRLFRSANHWWRISGPILWALHYGDWGIKLCFSHCYWSRSQLFLVLGYSLANRAGDLMIKENYNLLPTQNPCWLCTGFHAIMLLVLAFNLLSAMVWEMQWICADFLLFEYL